jgi:hypothetical protein
LLYAERQKGDQRMKWFMVAAMSLALLGCETDEDEARETLEKSGFSDISTGDSTFYGCGHGDKMGREFRAKNVAGKVVTGIVCCGQWKSCTVRF